MEFLFDRRRAVEIAVVFGVGVVAASVAAFIQCPGVQLSLTLKTVGFQARVNSDGGEASYIRGIAARKVSWEPLSVKMSASNSVLSPELTQHSAVSEVQAAGDGVVELAELSIPNDAWLAFGVGIDRKRRTFLDIEVITANSAPGSLTLVRPTTEGNDGPRVSVLAPKYRFFEPELAVPFPVPPRVLGLTFTTRVPSGNSNVPVSMVREGVIQFFYRSRLVATRAFGAGDVLYFDGLNAEITSLDMDADSLTVRVFGTARDVRTGSGSAVSSIHPTLFDGLAAQPWLPPIIGAIAGLAVAWFGVLTGRRNTVASTID